MPSNEYDKLEKNAPEYIQIKIIDKKIFDKGDCLIDIEYVALVTGVSRSKSNLQINDKIYIYSWLINRNKSCDAGGPQPPKTLSVGWNGNAYLKNMKRKGAYEIAALKKSFEDIK